MGVYKSGPPPQELLDATDLERMKEYLEQSGIVSDRLHPPDGPKKPE